jgi:hypothetical protein
MDPRLRGDDTLVDTDVGAVREPPLLFKDSQPPPAVIDSL